MAAISITMRHGDVPGDLQSFAEEKCGRLEKYLRGSPRIEVIFARDHELYHGEMILHGSRHHEHLVAHDAHADLKICIENLIEKIGRQLGRTKERRKDHRGPSHAERSSGPSPNESGDRDEPSYDDIVRRELKGEKPKQG